MKQKRKMTLLGKQSAAGWIFLTPATILIAVMAFWPMIQAFIMSLQTGSSANMQWAEPIFNNYKRMFADKLFLTSVGNTFLYLIIQVPIMLILAILLAQLLNNRDLRLKGFFRTCVFLPCATSLVSYSLIFKSLFATDGLVNTILVNLGILQDNYNFLGNSTSAKIVIIIALIWRWTGYNMVFYLAGLQNIEYSVYEAAKIDGASPRQILRHVTIPMVMPSITICTFLTLTNGFKLFDQNLALTNGAPSNMSELLALNIYRTFYGRTGWEGVGQAKAVLFFILVGVIALVQNKLTRSKEVQQ